MTNEDVIKTMLKLKDKADSYEKKCINKAIEALEKQIPKKPLKKVYDNAICPICREYVQIDMGATTLKAKRCMNCGQAIDWSNDNENNSL